MAGGPKRLDFGGADSGTALAALLAVEAVLFDEAAGGPNRLASWWAGCDAALAALLGAVDILFDEAGAPNKFVFGGANSGATLTVLPAAESVLSHSGVGAGVPNKLFFWKADFFAALSKLLAEEAVLLEEAA